MGRAGRQRVRVPRQPLLRARASYVRLLELHRAASICMSMVCRCCSVRQLRFFHSSAALLRRTRSTSAIASCARAADASASCCVHAAGVARCARYSQRLGSSTLSSWWVAPHCSSTRRLLAGPFQHGVPPWKLSAPGSPATLAGGTPSGGAATPAQRPRLVPPGSCVAPSKGHTLWAGV